MYRLLLPQVVDMYDSRTGKLTRWRLRVKELKFDVLHRPGAQHIAPDVRLSLPTLGYDAKPIDDDVSVFVIMDTNHLIYPWLDHDPIKDPVVILNVTEVETDSKDTPTTLRVLRDDEVDLLKFREKNNIETRAGDPIHI